MQSICVWSGSIVVIMEKGRGYVRQPEPCPVTQRFRGILGRLSLVDRTSGLPLPISFISFIDDKEKEDTHRDCSILEPGIRNTTNGGMEPLCIPQCIHDHPHLAPQLRLYTVQRPLEAQPEVVLLRC